MLGNPSYPTYQVFLAVGIAALVTGLLLPPFIRLMRHEGVGQQVRADGPQRHLQKQGTPTMGGAVILVGTVLTCALQASWTIDLVMAVLATLAAAAIGLLDDIESVAHGRSLGLTPRQKMLGLGVISVAFCLVGVNLGGVAPWVEFPGGGSVNLGVLTTVITLKSGFLLQIPWLYVLFVFLLFAGLSNAVNLTDGLDGLAGGCIAVVMLAMAMVAFRYDEINLSVFAGSIAGACIGFLWHNCHPASIFMGDTGSLALGAALAALAVLTKTEVTSLVMGGLFVIEALSVIGQVLSFRLLHRRIFLMAPIHHHFEKKGWAEDTVVIRFWIVSAAFAALGFALYFQLG
ncbi:phospho-N-acetylmuramoyl-pentapeptide-transferase [Olsenella phocaeensis]|uniref:phospho-N-acetylmuramoyl-pentapeptide- transferase n=1 Tax=Olsenella phocaeensis TaxID=1852385 RepID=UPI003A947C2C